MREMEEEEDVSSAIVTLNRLSLSAKRWSRVGSLTALMRHLRSCTVSEGDSLTQKAPFRRWPSAVQHRISSFGSRLVEGGGREGVYLGIAIVLGN